MLKIFVMAFIASWSLSAVAADFDLCICQTGDAPVNQIKYFKAGCKAWLSSASCTQKETNDIKTALYEPLQRYPQSKRVKLGYVGHWASATETVQFLRNKVTSSIEQYSLSYVDIDNTACLSNDNPYEILKYFRQIGTAKARPLNVRGNQANSAGMWDAVLPGKANFWAVANGGNMQAIFPNCQEFRGRNCYSNFQDGDTGVCYNSEQKKYDRLTCMKKGLHHEWLPANQLNLQITHYVDKVLHQFKLGLAGVDGGEVEMFWISDEAPLLSPANIPALLLAQLTGLQFNRLQALADIHQLPLTPVIKEHQQMKFPDLYAVFEKESEIIQQVFTTEAEALAYLSAVERDARIPLWAAAQPSLLEKAP